MVNVTNTLALHKVIHLLVFNSIQQCFPGSQICVFDDTLVFLLCQWTLAEPIHYRQRFQGLEGAQLAYQKATALEALVGVSDCELLRFAWLLLATIPCSRVERCYLLCGLTTDAILKKVRDWNVIRLQGTCGDLLLRVLHL